MSTTAGTPALTHQRTFTYRTTTEWLGRRNGRLSVKGRDPLVVSAPPEFRGEAAFLNPEELFVASIESCFMLTFVLMVEKYHLPVDAYFSECTGVLELANGEFRFTRIVIKPTVIINQADAAPRVLQILEHANRDCLITNSIQAEVKLQPDVVMSVSE